MGKTIDFQQQKDLRVWRTVMEELRVIQNLEPWTFLGPEDTFLYLPKAENRWIFFRWVPAAPNEVVLTVYPSLPAYRKSLETPQTYRESTRNFIESSYFEIYQTKAEDIPAMVAHRSEKPNGFPFGGFVKIHEADMEAILRRCGA